MRMIRGIRLAAGVLLALTAAAASAQGGANKSGGNAATVPLRVAFVYIGPPNDGGWNQAHDDGRKAVERELAGKITTQVISKVGEGPEAESAFQTAIDMGAKLVFGTSYGYGPHMAKLAAKHKDVRFEHATGYKTSDNLRVYDVRTYEGAYMAGILAGSMTQSKVLGVVGSMQIPEVFRNINAFTLGAQSVNPDIRTRVIWVNSWHSPAKEGAAAETLISEGADVLFQNTDSPSVLRTAQLKGKRAIGWDSDMSGFAPKAHLGSAIIRWGPYYLKAVNDALKGSWGGNSATWWGIKENTVDLVSLASDVPDATKQKLIETKKALQTERLLIWQGPLKDNTGREVLKSGAQGDDKFLKEMNFYVAGVDSALPGGQK
ncbi:BMP family ABC transporter substrate-binding protein [Ottowia testudinis]|uniref:BMP family ABC transporter substrate-binding protein n=1 Tax=Ottowia testudinis TaxID=2816950 RepID=A0A975CKL2_9BURK|nr:BMP family ABC transporter substrate-binding protein [Ottowia testudinis]QTD46717.1 BMP family ABC transporter substrate-binding protein [Ottowia testudinis]